MKTALMRKDDMQTYQPSAVDYDRNLFELKQKKPWLNETQLGKTFGISRHQVASYLRKWGFPDKTDSPELGFLPNSQYYSKSHNISFIKPLFGPSTFV